MTIFIALVLTVVAATLVPPLIVAWPLLLAKYVGWRLGFSTRLFSSVTPLDRFLGDMETQRAETVSVYAYEGICSIGSGTTALTGGAVELATHTGDFERRLRCLNIASFELLERAFARSHINPTMNVRSNGLAVHTSRAKAEQASRRELIERDVVLTHFYCHIPPAARLTWRLNVPAQSNDENVIALLGKHVDEATTFLLRSIYDDLDVVLSILRWRGTVGIGFGCGSLDTFATLTKSIAEAACLVKAASLPALRPVVARAERGDFRHVQATTFIEYAAALNVQPNELHCSIVLAELKDGRCLDFLYEAPEVSSVRAFFHSRVRCLDPDGRQIPAANVQARPLGSVCQIPRVARSTSDAAFVPGWPRANMSEIERVATLRGVRPFLGANTERPCIIA